ncbi:MAG: hypothetical protein HQL66_05745 [Magnetococcales bacterium]|nr:hypothetical protein [Magnetococcales bacterium]
MENTVRVTLSPHETVQIFGTGEVKIVAGSHVSVVKTPLLSLGGLTGTVKAGTLSLALTGPVLGLAGVILAMSWMGHLALKHAARGARSDTLPAVVADATPATP